MGRPGTMAALKAADREAGQAHYAWQAAALRHGPDSPQAAGAKAAYDQAAGRRAAAATALHAPRPADTCAICSPGQCPPGCPAR